MSHLPETKVINFSSRNCYLHLALVNQMVTFTDVRIQCYYSRYLRLRSEFVLRKLSHFDDQPVCSQKIKSLDGNCFPRFEKFFLISRLNSLTKQVLLCFG